MAHGCYMTQKIVTQVCIYIIICLTITLKQNRYILHKVIWKKWLAINIYFENVLTLYLKDFLVYNKEYLLLRTNLLVVVNTFQS